MLKSTLVKFEQCITRMDMNFALINQTLVLFVALVFNS
jgi:hypothetical protein